MKSKIKKIIPFSAVAYLLPYFAFAFPDTLGGVIGMFTDIGLRLMPLLGAIAFLLFVWGAAKFIRSAGSEKALQESKGLLIWGVVGIFVLFTIWGIIAFLRSEFGFGDGTPIIPQIRF